MSLRIPCCRVWGGTGTVNVKHGYRVDARYVVFRAVRRKSIGGKAEPETPREAPLCPGPASAQQGLARTVQRCPAVKEAGSRVTLSLWFSAVSVP